MRLGSFIPAVPGGHIITGSLAGLRATQPASGSLLFAIVLGNAAIGDGGGGIYYYVSADQATADNGGSVIVSADGGRWYLAYPWK